MVKALSLSLISGAAFAAQVGFFHRFLGLTWQGNDLWGMGLGGAAVYFMLRAPQGLPKFLGGLGVVALGFFSWHTRSLQVPWAAGMAAAIVAAYPVYLRSRTWLKPLSIAGAWLLGLYACTGKAALLLYGMQGVLFALLTLPFDVSSMDAERLPTLPRVYGRAFAVRLLRVGLGLYAVLAAVAPSPLRIIALATAAGGVLLTYWPFSFSQGGVIGYDLLLLAQGMLGLLL